MSPSVSILVCLAGAVAFVVLEWLLSRGGDRRQPSAAALRPESENGAGATPVARTLFSEPAPATREPAGAVAAANHEIVLRDAWEGLGLSGAACWLEARTAGDPGNPPVPAISCQIEFTPRDQASPEDLPRWFRPWRHALLAGETVCIPDAVSEPDLCGRVRLSAANLVLVPFLRSDTHLGVVALAWNRPASAGTEHLAAASSVGERLRACLEPTLTRREVRTLHERETVLLRVAAALRHAADLPLALRAILEATRDGLGFRNCAFLLADVSKGQLYVASQVGYGDRVDSLRLALDGPSVTATAARERRVVDVPDVTKWPGYVPGNEQIRSEIALPLIVDDELQGVLDVESTEPNAFSGSVGEILSAVAAESALVLAHTHTLRSLQERADQLQAADHLARAIATSIDPQTILQSAVQEARASIDADAALVLRRSGDGDTAWSVVAAPAGKSVQPPPLFDDSEALREIAGATQGGVFENAEEPSSALAAWCFDAGWRSAFWMPVVLDGRTVGLFVAGMHHAHALTGGRVATLRALSPHVVAAVRNAQLYEQLDFSYRQLQEASALNARNEQLRVLGEITSGLAHRFNNLLGVILGRVQTAAARAEGTDLERDLRIVEQAAYEGSITIRQLQQFTGTRAERAARPVAWSAIVERAVDRAARNWRPEDPAKAGRYEIGCEIAEAAWIEGIPEECEEIAEHLLHNAVEAMPEGGALRVRLTAGDEAWILEVSDTGPGIDEQTRARIFHPFVTTKGPRNLGLGLSIAYAIVTRHGGQIDAERAPGGGALLRVVLPAAEVPAEPPKPQLLASRAARVLVVDDEPAVAEVLAEMLQTAGHDCVSETSPARAVERLATETFDVVLSDLGMPGMTGWDLAFHCRDMHAEVPVILITGWGLELDDERVADAGVFEVLAKPFEMQAVLAAVSRALQRAQAKAA